MRILLVNPKFPESFWGLNRIQSVAGKRYVMPTLALPTIAALTPAGHGVILVDENVEEIDFDLPCDLVGVSCMGVQGLRAFEIAKAFRARGRTVVMGGSFPTLTPGMCRPHADVLFVGEAERTWPKFLDDFARGEWADVYEEQEKVDIEKSPVPRYDLLKMNRYFSQAVQFSRGCPYECEFCDIIVMLGRQPRNKTTLQFLEEVEEIYRLGGRRIFLVDDNFIGHKKKAKELLAAIRDWNATKGFTVSFTAETSLNVADDDELLQLLHDARFVRLFIGVESPRIESLDEVKKYANTTRCSILSQVQKVQSFGILVMAGMIVGFDNDDSSIFDEHQSFIQSARIPQVMCGMLQAFPRTPLFERLEREGRLTGEFMGDLFFATNIIPKQMTRSALMRGYLDLLRNLYDYDRYAERTIAYLAANRKLEPVQPKRKSWNEIQMLGRFLLFILCGGDAERRRFSRRILWATLRAKPNRLPDAIYLVVVHKHFYEFVGQCALSIEKELEHCVEVEWLETQAGTIA
jgi:radical SAM superfamily enzyme YgiQ (UPF0313 family)